MDSAVSSLLGQLSGLLVDEAKLLSGVRKDVQFIKDEMESMQGFLLDAADAGNNSHQVMAWRRQVREVAYGSQRCMDHYVQTLGASRPSAGLLGSVGRLPQLVRTMPSRHRIANRIKDLKARAQEVGERRQRYGVKPPTPTPSSRIDAVERRAGAGAPMLLSAQQQAVEHARKRRDIAHATDWVNSDAQHVMEWIAAAGDRKEAAQQDDHGGRRRKRIFFDFRRYLHVPHFTTMSLLTELNQVMGNKADATAFLMEHIIQMFEGSLYTLVHTLEEFLKSLSTKHASEDHQHIHMHAEEHKPITQQDDDKPKSKMASKEEGGGGGGSDNKPAPPPDPEKAEEHNKQKHHHHVREWLQRVQEKVSAAVAAASTSSEDHDDDAKKNNQGAGAGAGAVVDDRPSAEMASSVVDGQNNTMEEDAVKRKMSKEEAQDHKFHMISWLRRVLESQGIHLLDEEKMHHVPRLLAIVTPPVNQQNLEDGDPHELRRATEIARRVYDDFSRQGSRFDFTVWVDAERLSAESTGRLESILQQVLQQQEVQQHPSSSSGGPEKEERTTAEAGAEDETTKRMRLQQEIRERLEGKKFLIFLADHPEETPWTQILPALPSDLTEESAIILSPLVRQPYQYFGWYALSLCFLLRHSRYRVYFYSHLVATRNRASELLRVGSKHKGGEDLHDVINQILTCCRWDSFSSKIFLHALYANPRRSKPDLENLLRSLDEFSTVSNIRNMIGFCYDDLPYHYKICFQYLSSFPPESKIRRTSLVRRWAAEGLVVGRDGLAATAEAERCFDALIDRGLLLPADNIDTPSGKVKMCMVDHHVVSFITRLPRLNSSTAAVSIDLPPSLAHRLSIPCGIQLSKKTQRRAREGLKKQMDGGSQPAASSPQDSISEGVIKLLSLFPTSESGWIKVLDLEHCRGLKKKHLKTICNKAFQLKYLSLRNTGITELPKEINKLQDLETLDIRGTGIEYFPSKSIVLPKLEHLLSGGGYSDPPSKGDPTSGASSHESSTTIHITRGIRSMTNMKVLSHVKVSDGDDEAALDDLARLQVLWKLGVVIHGDNVHLLLKVLGMLNECLRSLSIRINNGVPDLNKTEKMFPPPRSLTSLSICGKIGGMPTAWIQKLEQLSDITLRDTFLTSSDIKILATLINLRFIRLLRESYKQKQLSFETGFRNLEFLIIEGSGTITDVQFDQKVAPKLEKIVWRSTCNCKMENLGIDNLEGLKEIELEGKCDLNRIRKSVQANPCHPKLTHISPTVNSPTLQLGESTAAAVGTSATNK